MTGDEQCYRAAQRRVECWTLGLGAAGALAAAGFWGWRESVGVGLGAALSWLNYRWLKQTVAALAAVAKGQPAAEPMRIPKRVYVKLLARYALLLGALYVILARFHWAVLPFLCGLFAVVAAVILEMICELARSWKKASAGRDSQG